MNAPPEGVGKEALFEIVDEHIAVITLNRPEVRNAMSTKLTAAIEYLVEKVESDPKLRVGVLASSNDRIFCAGADLSEVASGKQRRIVTPDGGFAGFVDARRDKLWIAAVQGYAVGGGFEMCLACDIIVASEDARFVLPEVKRGLLAASGGVHRIVRALPRNVAIEIVTTGEPINASRAYELGFVNRLVPSSQVAETALDLARLVAANAPIAVRESLKIARIAQEEKDADLRKLSVEARNFIGRTEDAKEGPRAFMEKRVPRWTGR